MDSWRPEKVQSEVKQRIERLMSEAEDQEMTSDEALQFAIKHLRGFDNTFDEAIEIKPDRTLENDLSIMEGFKQTGARNYKLLTRSGGIRNYVKWADENLPTRRD